MNIEVKVKKLSHFDSAISLPTYESLGAAGADVRAQLHHLGDEIRLSPGERTLIPTGLCLEIPEGYEMQVRPRSGLALNSGLMILNSPGTVDSDYRGEFKIVIGNMGKKEEIIKHGDRIAQIILAPVVRAQFVLNADLTQTARGDGGFGHSGIR